MRTINRDPFARTDLVRRSIRSAVPLCSWCGQSRKDGTLYEYGTERDDRPGERNVGWHKDLFCCKSCHDSYYFG